MDFGQAIAALKEGKKVQRAGWNGKNMYLYLQGPTYVPATANGLPTRAFESVIVMYTAQGKHQPGWLASQADMLAEDWAIVDSGG